MAINPAGLLPEPGANEERVDMTFPDETLPPISLRCVECSALYPMIEAERPGRPQGASLMGGTRYRCDCGGVLDVEMQFALPKQYAHLSATQLLKLAEQYYQAAQNTASLTEKDRDLKQLGLLLRALAAKH